MAERAEQLLTSANEAAGLVQKVYFTYLLVTLYLAILVGSTTHEQLLRESGVPLPIFGVGLSIFWIYALAPWLYVALHVNLVVQHYLLSRKLHRFSDAIQGKDDEQEWRVRLYPSLFAQMLAGAEPGSIKSLVLRTTIFMTVIVAPVTLLLWMQIRFLPYHSEAVTWGNRLAVFVDLILLWYYWPIVDETDGEWRAFSHRGDDGSEIEWRIVRPLLGIVLSVGIFVVATFVAVVPGGSIEGAMDYVTGGRVAKTVDKWWGERRLAASCEAGGSGPLDKKNEAGGSSPLDEEDEEPLRLHAGFEECLSEFSFRSCFVRHLDVREATLLDKEPPPELLAAYHPRKDGIETERPLDGMVGLNLKERDLRGAILREADLTRADLEGADLTGADLGCTTLIEAKFSHSTLIGAQVPGAGLLAALAGAKLARVDLKGQNLAGADLRGANLEKAILEDANLIGADLSRAQLGRADLRNAKLLGADLTHADLKGAQLTNAKLDGADLSYAEFHGADLTGAELQGSTFSSAAFVAAALTGAKLAGFDLKGQNLAGADLRGANLEKAILEDANLIGADLSRAQLGRADLRNAKLLGADLTHADLKGAQLTNAEVDGAVFEGAKLNFAKLGGIRFGKGEWQKEVTAITRELDAIANESSQIHRKLLNRSLDRLSSMKDDGSKLSLAKAEGTFYANEELCKKINEPQLPESPQGEIGSENQVEQLLDAARELKCLFEGNRSSFDITTKRESARQQETSSLDEPEDVEPK